MKKRKIIHIKKELFANKIKHKIEDIIKDKDFAKKVDEELAKMSPEEKLGGILSDVGPAPELLNSLGYTPDMLIEKFKFTEKGLRNVGYTPSKLKELGFEVSKYYKRFKIRK